MDDAGARFTGPTVVCVRGPSRSGKTSLIERLVPRLEARGHRVAYLKRTHHRLDLPEKASGRIWARGPSMMLLSAPDRLQVTLPPRDGSALSLLELVPAEVDIAFLETHSAEEFPTILYAGEDSERGEEVLGRWSLVSLDRDAGVLSERVAELMPADRRLERALRSAVGFHGGHACAGIILGARLALHGAGELGIDVPDREKRLLVDVETARCATDAVQAVTGCRPGRRSLRILDYGKLAATFIDQWSGAAVRVAARGDLRERIGAIGEDRREVQCRAYLSMSSDELFITRRVRPCRGELDLPGPPRRRINCGACGEEVSDGRDVKVGGGAFCRPCAGRIAATSNEGERRWASTGVRS